MKDTIITARSKKIELLVLSICLMTSILLDLISIIIYNTKWIELLTQWHVELLLALFLYACTWAVRLAIIVVKKIFQNI